jgi:hypothetical protein
METAIEYTGWIFNYLFFASILYFVKILFTHGEDFSFFEGATILKFLALNLEFKDCWRG